MTYNIWGRTVPFSARYCAQVEGCLESDARRDAGDLYRFARYRAVISVGGVVLSIQYATSEAGALRTAMSVVRQRRKAGQLKSLRGEA